MPHLRLSKVDRRPSRNQPKTHNHRPALAKLLGNIAVDNQADDLTALRAVREAGLPAGGDLVGAV